VACRQALREGGHRRPLTQNRYSLAGANPVSFVEIDGHHAIADGGGGAATTPSVTAATAAPQPDQEPAPAPEPKRNLAQRLWHNTTEFVGGAKDGGVDAGKGLYQLGYDTFYGSSPFADELTQAETKARAGPRRAGQEPGQARRGGQGPLRAGHQLRA
jgi:hypothetical protein